MRKAMLAAMGILGAAIVLFAAFESYAVIRAKAHTPAVIAETARRDVTLSQIGKRRLAMLLRVEDPGFFRHRGVDFTTPGQGMTTLTQGLVKRLYFDGGFKPGFAKIEQSLIARFVLDPAISKRDQLEIFLNRASFGTSRGRQVIGFDDAARTFYQRPITALDDRQYLGLVAMLMAPGTLDPVRHPRENAERINRIVALLAGRCRPRNLRDVRLQDCAGTALSS
jgi:membrane peptidoglycan carboxypeptidase